MSPPGIGLPSWDSGPPGPWHILPGSCEDCGVRFRDGRAFKKVALHVHWDEEQFGAVEKVRRVLAARKDVSGLSIDGKTGDVTFELETSNGASLAEVIAELARNGFEAHEEAGE